MAQKQRLLFIGDSLTEWFNLRKYFPEAETFNEGIAGDTTYGVLERLDSIFRIKSDIIFLMIGINDIFNGFQKEDILENLQLIIEQILTHANGSVLIVQSILPVNESMLETGAYLNETIRHINRELKSHCEARCNSYLDLYSHFLEGDELMREYTTDGGHLSEAGYNLWAKIIATSFLNRRTEG